jgi:TATA-binding protein-associated factor Taf7
MGEDLRHGTLYFDHYVLPSKVVDLPCIIESHKSIDKKVVYKTADICQVKKERLIMWYFMC